MESIGRRTAVTNIAILPAASEKLLALSGV